MGLWNGWRILALLVCIVCLLWGALPLTASRVHVGCLAMIGAGIIGAAVCVWWPQTLSLWHRAGATLFGKILLSAATGLVVAVFVLFTVVSVLMAVAACKPAPENATVVVLGAGLRGERPSRTLRERLDAAYEYLAAHPQAACVLSGGQGLDEPCTEAAAMKTYLVNKGIDESRLYMEERSTSTAENMEFSRQIIEENGLSPAIAVVTQEFHQCRAQAFAKKHEFETVGAVTAHTKWDLFPSYWIRDFAGLCHMAVFGS